MKRLAMAALCAACVASCQKAGPGGGNGFGAMKATLITGAPIAALAGVRIDVLRGAAVVDTQTIALGTIVPPGTTVPQTGGDAFFLIPPGTYDVNATPIDATGKPTNACTTAHASAAVVQDKTTEIILSLFCGNVGPGGLDVIVVVKQGPTIKRFVLDPSKFTTACDQITLEVGAESGDGGALKFQWTVVAAPPNAKVTFVPAADQAIFSAQTPGDYLISVQAIDAAGHSAGLTVPLHVADGPLCTGPASNLVLTAFADPHLVNKAPFPPFVDNIPAELRNEGEQRRIPQGLLRGDLKPQVQSSGPFTPPNLKGPQGPITIPVNTAFGNQVSFGGSPPDMSGASSGRVVLVTGNTWAAWSSNGGATFNTINPSTIFPSAPSLDSNGLRLDGGLCCDQIIQYVPSIDRFIWLMQFWGTAGVSGANMYRIASASPAQLVASGGTSWTYWDLRSGTFGLGTSFLDYPDMSYSNSYLNVSIDQVGTGLLVTRIPLTQLRDSQTIYFDYTHPADSGSAYGGHLMQNTGDELFWAGHMNNSQMRIYSLHEGDNHYFWRNLDINSWPNTGYASITPDGVTDWLGFGFPGGAVVGATRRNGSINGGRFDQLWFAWSAGTGGGFSQSHVQIAVVNRANFSLSSQLQIWNGSFAFSYPYLATSQSGEIGLAVSLGGRGIQATSAFGFWGDFLVYTMANSALSQGRWGDYITVRRDGADPDTFDATGYAIAQPPNSGAYYDPHFVKFSRGGIPAPGNINR